MKLLFTGLLNKRMTDILSNALSKLNIHDTYTHLYTFNDLIDHYDTFSENTWNSWTYKSESIPFKSSIAFIGNGEEKLKKELNVNENLGGQNKTFDLIHDKLGEISVKDMTLGDCVLGTDGSHWMHSIFRKLLYPLCSWSEKYSNKCNFSKEIYDILNQSYGKSKITIFEGIERCELSQANFTKLNFILKNIKNNYEKNNSKYSSIQSEYIHDICFFLNDYDFQEKMNHCVQNEAIHKTLIIVHEKKGWLIAKDLSKITCPRITRGSPRIHVNL